MDAFTRKIGVSGEFTNEALELCDNLIREKRIWRGKVLLRRSKAICMALKKEF